MSVVTLGDIALCQYTTTVKERVYSLSFSSHIIFGLSSLILSFGEDNPQDNAWVIDARPTISPEGNLIDNLIVVSTKLKARLTWHFVDRQYSPERLDHRLSGTFTGLSTYSNSLYAAALALNIFRYDASHLMTDSSKRFSCTMYMPYSTMYMECCQAGYVLQH